MNSKYEKVPLDGGNEFDLEGVKFGDKKTFIYWKKKSTQSIKEVFVVFNKQYENIALHEGGAILSLKGLSNYHDLQEAITIFKDIVQTQQIQFHFVVGNENERMMAEALGRNLGLSYVIQNMNQQRIESQQKAMEESLRKENQENLKAGGNKIIETYQNGALKQITVHDGKAYENHGILNSEEEKMILLKEWMKDPIKAQELASLSDEARNELLTQAVMSNRKEYRMESSRDQMANNMVGKVAIAKASEEDGFVNAELGIVQNNVSSANEYSAVEMQGDRVQVVNPNVIHSNIQSSNGTVYSNMTSGSNSTDFESYNGDVQAEENQEQEREVEKVFYLDEEGTLYDADGNPLCKIGTEGYEIDYNNNAILKEGQTVGYIGDYKDMGRSKTNVYHKTKVYTRKPQQPDKRAAFVSLPVIIFILSALLLIVSAVLLFIVD